MNVLMWTRSWRQRRAEKGQEGGETESQHENESWKESKAAGAESRLGE